MHITPEIKTFLVALGFPELPDLQYDRYRGARRWSSLPYLYLNESKHVGWRPSRKDTPNVVVLQAYHHSAELKPFQANVTTPGVLKEAQAWIVKAKAEAEALWAANAKETERRDLAAARLSQDTAAFTP